MSILSDRQIIDLCVPPTEVYDSKIDAQLGPEMELGVYYPDPTVRAANEAYRIAQRRKRCMRPPTAEELAAFVPMISPFSAEQIRCEDDRKIISHGVTSYGYDVTLAEEFKVFSNLNAAIINPKKFNSEANLVDAKLMQDEKGAKYVVLPPNSYLLGRTREYFRMPRDVLAIALGKSTYARVGVAVNVTPIEPGFHGNVVIEVANQTTSPIMIFANEGISQFVFFRGEPCQTSYADRGGKYQGQTGVTVARV